MTNPTTPPKRLIIGITGATGVVYAVRILQILRATTQIESHLIISEAGIMSLHQEVGMKKQQLEAMADKVYNVKDIGAAIASGSFLTDGMIIAPCSMKTLASVALGLSENLISRAADVTLKERRRLVMLVRETPLNLAHLRNMTSVTEMGGIIFPPVPSFYQHPASIAEMVDHSVGRVLDLFNIAHQLTPEWPGLKPSDQAQS
ncbi:UbiX family flavin prenyltransferase [Sapientia aquatica]|uniref:Flavin prenyltransferase UbiX n=1 Tax=Sapientia aquatica TaxID=1549640 RepID=A0A4R5W1A9_9BURK|nr:UbiX family flavin prenyltransferase [Sapientia aquatica]TDK65312.1 UbiX family flavin prenyltransferase [Sapientia aquatica]